MRYVYVKTVEAKENRVDIWLETSKELDEYFLPDKHFFAEYDFPVENIPTEILTIPLLLNLIPFSWIVDCIVWVEKIDRRFYRCLPMLKNGFQEMYPDEKLRGTLIPAKFYDNSYETKCEAVQLFTGGVDAMATFFRHKNEYPILLNTYGWFEDRIEENVVCETDRKNIRKFAQEQGVGSCFTRSNFGKFIRTKKINEAMKGRFNNSWWFGFQHSMAFIGLAAPAAYYYAAKRIYIASSYTFGKRVLCASDPTTDSQIEFAACRVVHDGYELSRQRKIELIVAQKKDMKERVALRVCSFNDHNCCRCEKCFRTMLGIVAEGGNIADYDFALEKPFYEALNEHLDNEVQFLDADHIVFWQEVVARMRENYDNVFDKAVADFLLHYDFEREKKRGLWRYYRRNFFSILKRKIKGLLMKGN